MSLEINAPAAPNLPLAPADYNRQYGDQLNNVFRLYFNRLGSNLENLIVFVNALETDVATLQSQVATLQSQVATLEDQVATANTLIWMDM